MKLQPTLATSLLAIAAIFSLNVSAADAPADTKTEKVEAKTPMKPHSHMEEKTGLKAPAKKAAPVKAAQDSAAPEATASEADKKVNPAKDKSKHFHPRDGGKQ